MSDRESIATVLARLSDGPADDRVSFGNVVDRLGTRAYGLLLLLLAAPNLTPGPSMPGFSTIFGVPLCLIAAQMALGRANLWLPRRLSAYSVTRARLAGFLRRMVPLLTRFELILRPRWAWLSGPHMERWVGLACLLLGVLLALPIPVFSLVPAFAIVITALGILTGDGVAIALGFVAGIGTVVAFVAAVKLLLTAFGLA
ncbi:MAG: exopolysaccharide biosynthesis protein [Proteobacteria bacterium]|nr:exopolysaccharide biosynthesis protein [Pseudomonadota bacterium]